MSERVEREFKEWQEKYEIPFNQEFQVKTLLKLQEEYDGIECGSNTTKTREVLLHMIQDLSTRLNISPKIRTRDKLYVDVFILDGKSKCYIYYKDKLCIIADKNIEETAGIINRIIHQEGCEVYTDGLGVTYGLIDELERKGIKVNRLNKQKLNEFGFYI